MTIGFEDLVALSIVFAAAAYLGWLAVGAVRRRADTGCGSACSRCSGGSVGSDAAQEQFVSIGSISRPGS
ncbi:MAG: hypothetical protein U0790_22510 [Isosphaeraceae bacterium]